MSKEPDGSACIPLEPGEARQARPDLTADELAFYWLALQPPGSESLDAAIDEFLRTLFTFWDPTCERRTVLYVISEPGSERWARGCGPTVNLPASEVETQPRGVDILVIEPYGDRWGRFGSKSTPPGSVGDLLEAVGRPGAMRLLVVNDHVLSDSEGYEVQLRRHDGRWQLIWFKNLWI